jgi:dimethylargininase
MTYSWGRRLIASFLSAFLVALIVHVANITVFTIAYLSSQTSPAGIALLPQVSNLFAMTSVFALVLLFIGGIVGMYAKWWTALIGAAVVALITGGLGSVLLIATSGGGSSNFAAAVINSMAGFELFYMIALTVLAATVGRRWFHAFAGWVGSGTREEKVAFVRIPSSNLEQGVVTHIERSDVDRDTADHQWDDYVAALVRSGWRTVEVAAADALPDSVFIEDTAVILGGTAIVGRAGVESREGESEAVERSLREQTYDIEVIEEPGTLEGGDVLVVGDTIYVGRSGRTNAEGVRQLRAIAGPLGYTVIAVPVSATLHLKSAVTALPDGTVVGNPGVVPDTSAFDRFLAVPEASGGSVVVLGHDTVLIASSAPMSAELIEDLGYRVVQVDIGEFEKLEGSVTCLSVRSR